MADYRRTLRPSSRKVAIASGEKTYIPQNTVSEPVTEFVQMCRHSITGRGVVYQGLSPFSAQEPSELRGKLVRMDGMVYRIVGVECRPVRSGIRAGNPVGLLLDPVLS